MDSKRLILSRRHSACWHRVAVTTAIAAAEAPTAAQALGLTPIQPLVEYTIPTKEEAAQCTIRPEKENNVTAWVVRNRQGEILRRFADTNGDNVVDQWCYYLERPRGVSRHRCEFQRQGRPVSLVPHGRHAVGRRQERRRPDRRLASDLGARSRRAGGVRAQDARPGAVRAAAG